MGDMKEMITILFRKTSASFSAPLSPILLPPRFSVVSVCDSKETIMKNIEKKWLLLYFLVVHQPNIVFHHARGDYLVGLKI